MSATSEDRSRSPAPKDFRVVFAASVWTVITLIAAALLSRRLAGAFGTARTVALPCVAGTVATLFSLAAYALWTAANPAADGRRRVIVAVLTVLSPLVVADVLWTTPSAFAAGYLGALFILAGLATLFIRDLVPVAWESLQQDRSIALAPVATGSEPQMIAMPASAALNSREADCVGLSFEDAVDEEFSDEVDPTLSQSIVRRQPACGAEIVEGTVRISFRVGERTAVAHVSFVPPLAERPRAECQVLSDFDGRVRIGLSQAYGLRIEARRSEPASAATDVVVGFSAEVRAAQCEAA
jgi:hypothetical protein